MDAKSDSKLAHPGEIGDVVEHLFRNESAKMVAVLTGIFGLEHLTLAEDVVQEALVRALQTWPFYGVPDNPSAWIMRTSKNLALDVVRRQKVFREKEAQIISLIERPEASIDTSIFSEGEIQDDRLRMMFVCCHPVIPPEAQVALTLKTLCGFNISEISRAFLTTEAAIAKRLTRAKQAIREAGIAFEIPAGEELGKRLEAVLQSLYLLFNEGYKASSGEKLVREDICQEAIRLGTLLAGHPSGNTPGTHALLALMLLNTSRAPSRIDDQGNLLLLKDQDRSLWNRSMIARGMYHLFQSGDGSAITEYHLQAGIAACHCRAPDYASTDWGQIADFYDRLIQLNDSPVIALNRAVAIGQAKGPEKGILVLKQIKSKSLESYYLYYAVLADFEDRLNQWDASEESFRRALSLTSLESEKNFLKKSLDKLMDKKGKAALKA